MTKLRLLLFLSIFISATFSLPVESSADTLISGSTISIVDAITNEASTFQSAAGGGIFFEETSEKLYFVGPNNSILRSDRDGSNVVSIIADAGGEVADLVVDTTSQKLIWTQPNDALIRSSDLNGSNIANLIVGYSVPQGLVIDQANQKLYWAGFSEIFTAQTDGSGIQSVYLDPATSPLYRLVLVGDVIYYTNKTTGTLKAVKTDGSAAGTVLTGQTNITGISYHAGENRLHFIGGLSGVALSSCKLDGSDTKQIASLSGEDLITNFFVKKEKTSVPLQPEETPAPPPAAITPEPEPQYTRIYFTLDSPDQQYGRIVWTSSDRNITVLKSGHVSLISPRGAGYSRSQNRFYWLSKGVNIAKIYSMDAFTSAVSSPVNHLAVAYAYRSLIVDDENDRMYLSVATEDLATYSYSDGLFRLHNISGQEVANGFSFVGNELWWVIGKSIYGVARDYDPKVSTPIRLVGSYQNAQPIAIANSTAGAVLLYKSEGYYGIDSLDSTISTPFDDIKLPLLAYDYQHMVVQHLDPEVFDVPYIIYLSHDNKVDAIFFFNGKGALIKDYYIFEADGTALNVTGMVEVPLDGKAVPVYSPSTKSIIGTLKFVDFATSPSAKSTSLAGIKVHLTRSSGGGSDIALSTQSTTTDADGVYRFDNLEEGVKYRLNFERDDLQFNFPSLITTSGTEAPPVLVAPAPIAELGCAAKAANKSVTSADLKNNAVARHGILAAGKALRKLKGKARTKLIRASDKVNNTYADLLTSSRELPLVELECEATTICTAIDATNSAKSYRSKSAKLARSVAALLRKSTQGDKTKLTKSLAKLKKLDAAVKKAVRKLPTRSYSCPSGIETGSPD